MLDRKYWGRHGEYGPFREQADGWPNRGEVIKKYRKLKKMSAKRLGELYGNATVGRPLGERWVQRMEKDNLVPKDESRRAALASILGIPPILLGLSSLEHILPQNVMAQQPAGSAARTLHSVHVNGDTLKQYDKFLTLFWKLDYSSTAKDSLTDIEGMISDLRSFVPLVSGVEQAQVYELLCGFYPLASTIYCDQRHYPKALTHADSAVQLSESLDNNRLRALAQYQRGFVKLQQAIVSPDRQGVANQRLINDAIADLETARPYASPQVEASILLDQGWAYSLRKGSSGDATKALKAVDNAETIVGRGRFTDGSFMDTYANINKGKVHLGRAITLIEIRHFEDANDELTDAEKAIAHDQTRRWAYINMLWAKLHIGQRSYSVATEHALNATAMSRSINSLATASILKDIHTQLRNSSYGTSKAVRDLGAALILPLI